MREELTVPLENIADVHNVHLTPSRAVEEATRARALVHFNGGNRWPVRCLVRLSRRIEFLRTHFVGYREMSDQMLAEADEKRARHFCTALEEQCRLKAHQIQGFVSHLREKGSNGTTNVREDARGACRYTAQTDRSLRGIRRSGSNSHTGRPSRATPRANASLCATY